MNKKTAILLLPSSLLLFVLGFLITFATNSAMQSLYYVIVFTFLITGAIQTFSFFWNKEYEQKMFLNLIIGVTSIWFALFTLKYYAMFIVLLPALISIYSVVMGIGLLMKYYNEIRSKWFVGGAIFSFLFAIILLFKPILLATIYIKLSGLYLIALSLYFLVNAVLRLIEKE